MMELAFSFLVSIVLISVSVVLGVLMMYGCFLGWSKFYDITRGRNG